MDIVFFGTPPFAAEVLRFLVNNGVTVVAVVTKLDRPKGRSITPKPSAVKQLAQTLGIPVLQPEIASTPEFAAVLATYHADLFVVVAYGEIIKQNLLDLPRLGCINLHASLLPKYRGAAPIQHALLNGEILTGVTIFYLTKKMDAGDMIARSEVPIGPNTTFPELEKALCLAGQHTTLDVIRALNVGPIPRTPQDHSQATLAPKIELEQCEIHWDLPAKQLHNLVRAVTPDPGAWCYMLVRGQKKRCKILETRIVEGMAAPPGTIVAYGKELTVACGIDALRLVTIQLEGKKVMPAEEFVHGFPKESLAFQEAT